MSHTDTANTFFVAMSVPPGSTFRLKNSALTLGGYQGFLSFLVGGGRGRDWDLMFLLQPMCVMHYWLLLDSVAMCHLKICM